MAPRRYDAEKVDPSPLGQPLSFPFSGRTAKNRFLKGAMTERMSSWDPQNLEARGVPPPELINLYRRWGEGGFGLILTGNVMIEYDHLEAPGNPIIPRGAPFSGPRFDAFRDLATASKAHGSLVVAQISHPGRQVSQDVQEHPISPSDVQLVSEMGKFAKPRPMEEADFAAVTEGFAHAAEYCHRAGYDGIQLHGAHGYLLAQFLAETTNKRTDKYGGSLENRARFIIDLAAAVRARVGDPSFILGIKVNSVEFQAGGFGPEDCTTLCALLEAHGFDFVELSGGNYESLAFAHRRESTKRREAFFLEFAEQITAAIHQTRTYVTGGLRTARAMVDALDTVDGVGLARPVCAEADLPRKLLSGEVLSAIHELIDEGDFGLGSAAAGAHMNLLGLDKQPLDFSRQDHFEKLTDSVAKWTESMADNADKSKYGHVKIDGIQLEPYGAPYAAA